MFGAPVVNNATVVRHRHTADRIASSSRGVSEGRICFVNGLDGFVQVIFEFVVFRLSVPR